jgi:hypothetical protein
MYTMHGYGQILADIIEMVECDHAVTEVSSFFTKPDLSGVAKKFSVGDLKFRIALDDIEVPNYRVIVMQSQGCLLAKSTINDLFNGELVATFINAFIVRFEEMGL